MISIQIDNEAVNVNKEIFARLIWRPEKDKYDPKSGRISIYWVTEGRGSRDWYEVSSLRLSSNDFQTHRNKDLKFAFCLPKNVPLSHCGVLFRLRWFISVKVQYSGFGLFGDSETFKLPILVVDN